MGEWSGGRPDRSRGLERLENRASRNSPSFAVALNCGIGSSSLNAEVNAFERLQIGSRPEFFVPRLEVQVMHGAGKVFHRISSKRTSGSRPRPAIPKTYRIPMRTSYHKVR